MLENIRENETSRRVGQSIAAANLPDNKKYKMNGRERVALAMQHKRLVSAQCPRSEVACTNSVNPSKSLGPVS